MYWEDDDQTMSLDEVSRHEPHVIDLKDQLLLMNGKCAHAVEAFEWGKIFNHLVHQSHIFEFERGKCERVEAKRLYMAIRGKNSIGYESTPST